MSRWQRTLFAAFSVWAAAFAPVVAQDKEAKPLFQKTGELTDQDPMDKIQKKSYSKVHEMKMEEGKTYRIDVVSKDFDTFLRVENSDGRMLGADDDGGGGLNSRLVFKAPKSSEYRLIVTSFPPAETGKYSLVVTEPSKADMLASRVRELPQMNGEDRTETINDLLEHLGKQGAKLGQADAKLAFDAAFALENRKAPGVADLYTKLGKALSQSEDQKVAGMAKLFEGSARRIRLPGNSMDINGTLLDGKKIDWASYRGKVVLVDFWATWCGPCVGEIPNMKKLYDAYKGKGFEIVGISLDRDADAPKKFMEKRELGWACIFEEGGRQPLADHYGVMAIPLAIVVNKQGRVISMNARGPELARILERELGPIPEPKTDEKIEEKK